MKKNNKNNKNNNNFSLINLILIILVVIIIYLLCKRIYKYLFIQKNIELFASNGAPNTIQPLVGADPV